MFVITWGWVNFTVNYPIHSARQHLWMKCRVSNKQLSLKKAGYTSNLTENSVVSTINTDPWTSDSTFNFTPGKEICAVTKPSATRAELYRSSLRSFPLILKAIFTLHQKDFTDGLSYLFFLFSAHSRTKQECVAYCNFSRENSFHKIYFLFLAWDIIWAASASFSTLDWNQACFPHINIFNLNQSECVMI